MVQKAVATPLFLYHKGDKVLRLGFAGLLLLQKRFSH
jgi:hypothetical protein